MTSLCSIGAWSLELQLVMERSKVKTFRAQLWTDLGYEIKSCVIAAVARCRNDSPPTRCESSELGASELAVDG